ncbi:MAG: proline--tRNA ligase [Firmicutes bacterium]|nr:proline--tRNA ligase [Bacillota bacterium]
MKRSNYFIPTLKEKPSDIEQQSQVYMFRAGMLKKQANGLFVYLPLMQRAMEKVNAVIKKHMAEAKSFECKFPILVSKELLDSSGRWNAFGKEMFRLKDRSENEFAISPTNEETACFVAQTYVKSYKDLPFSIYQIQSKHRDEISPRNGVMRAREFTMKDAYSFHASEECLTEYYGKMRQAYLNIFSDLGLKVVAVSADTGAMGGSGSEEIMAISDSGETDICVCSSCDYASNSEAVPCGIGKKISKKAFKTVISYKKVETPRVKTIEELVVFFNKSASDFCKAVCFNADGKLVIALVRGDREVNDIKLKKVLGCNELEIASPEMVAKSKKTVVGFVGPVGLKGIKIYADFEVGAMQDFIVGANEKDYHFDGVNPSDFKAEYADLRFAVEGEPCPKCGIKTNFSKATELGHIFMLGRRYTDKLGMQFATKEGGLKTLTMGCYGIGVERTIASIIEQHMDDKGMVWPQQIAPFLVDLITVDVNNEEQIALSKTLYNELNNQNVNVLWDDTDARPGSKFADAELIGFPYRLVVGRGAGENKVELVIRKTGEKLELSPEEAIKIIIK